MCYNMFVMANKELITGVSMYKCSNCGIEFQAKREAKYCSINCRVTANRKKSIVTDNVTFSDPIVTDKFEFTIKQSSEEIKQMKSKETVRTALYWYDVPLAAVPRYKKGYPKMPEYMNGRQYFLWFKNQFQVNGDSPVLHNPFPASDKPLVYVTAGENSRHWGTN